MMLLLLLAILPHTEVTTDHIPCVEHNHYYDFNGSHVFDQIIYRDSDGSIIAWRLVKSPHQLPVGKTAIWFDGERLRKVTANHVVDSWTQYDPELCDRNERPTNQRRELTPANITTRRAKELTDYGSSNP